MWHFGAEGAYQVIVWLVHGRLLPVLSIALLFSDVCTCWSDLLHSGKASVGCSMHIPNVPIPSRLVLSVKNGIYIAALNKTTLVG